MKAVRCTLPGRVETLDVAPPASDGVRVLVRSAGICSSYLKLVAGGGTHVTLGHEFAGVLHDGTHVAVQPTVACGTCRHCIVGEDQRCSSSLRNLYGITVDGGLADEVVVDPRCLVPLPDGIDVETAALVEPLAVVVQALNRAAPQRHERVLVVGAGSIGLCTAAAARARGLDVDVAARHQHQRRAAETIGASLPRREEL